MCMHEDGWIKSTCPYCGVGCGIEARPTSKGRLEIRGDKAHPSNYGKLCTKGIALGDTVITDGRLLSPTHRTRTLDAVTETSKTWDEATSLVAQQFQKTIEQYGPESVAFYVSGQLLTEDYYVANKLMKGFIGSGNIDSNSRLCMASSVVGHKRAFGSDTVPVVYEDIELADLVVITGSNLAWCHPVLFQRLKTAKQNNPNMKVVVIDPRETATCELADLHLAIDSGSDVALFNGLLNHLALTEHLNTHYIEHHTQGFDNTLAAAKQIGDVDSITGLTQSQLDEFYALFANTDKTVTIYSQGVNQSTSGSDKVNSILNCHLATGRIGQPGMGPFSVTGQPNAMGGREVGALANTLASHMEFDNPMHHSLISEFWQTSTLATKPGLKAIDLFDAIEEGKIKAVWIMATNPMVSLPNSEKIKSALQKCPFVVVSDCIKETETAQLADVLLPAQGWSEKSGTVSNSERRISRQRRLLPSPGMAKPDWWIVSQVAMKMGFTDAFDYLHEGQIFNEYARMTTLDNENGQQRDLTLTGLTQLDDKGYNTLVPQQWPVLALQTEVVNQRLFKQHQFYTTNQKAHFIATEYQPPQQATDTTRPILLNSGRTRDHWHTMSRTGLSPQLASHTPEPFVSLHPDTALMWGLNSGDIAELSNPHANIHMRVTIDSGITPNQAFVPIHWNFATASNAKACQLISPYTDPFSGQPEFKHTPVSIKPWSKQCEALVISRTPLNLSDMDYWVKQKVESGYLYRIASKSDAMSLIVQLTNTIVMDNNKTLSFDSGITDSEHRKAVISANIMQRAFIVKATIQEHDLDWLTSLFEQPVDDNLESQFMRRADLVQPSQVE
ncbi:molybdopterin oxidoreductase family protein [Vibrio methylphosphonaticus]|uniref:molybdopterin oxidoreductase family protein n=1 Tax=Vibrio methylphosphonaticus TaxID=2946866 RepID=UPI00202A4860|nr:nitrate reductase [Vibrio methylphosphonaticus]MCL9774637.1 nitrate reductase [Vibrio methylphosphonaticus]